jgi:hypothetical protein
MLNRVERRQVGWLVKTDLAPARKLDRRLDSPFGRFYFGAAHILGFQRFDHPIQIIAHEVQDRAKQLMLCVSLHEIIHGRMKREFRRRQRENQPSVACIDGAKAQDIAEEGSICFGIFAVHQDVCAGNHAASMC